MGAEIDRMTHILRLGEDLSDRKAVPAIGTGDVLSAFPYRSEEHTSELQSLSC